MDEFQEARRLQRWGQVDKALHLVLVLVMIGAASLLIARELRELRKGALP